MNPLYTLSRLQRRYAGRTVLDISALEIGAGETLAIVGPSGAGKSTLLRLLNFLESPDAGELRFRNQCVEMGAAALALRRQVTTVFQKPALLQRTVAENVAYGLRLRGDRVTRAHVLSLLEEVGLAALANQPARQLSGGEAQRVALARAMALHPAALLLDEPTANLDPANVALIEACIQRLNHHEGTTIVLVTHNLFQAQRMAERTALLLEGSLIETGPTEALFTSPHDARTAAFVRGKMIY